MIGLENVALSLSGLDPRALGVPSDNPVRGLIELAGSRGFRAVQLSAAASGARPRELDRSGRRDLAATLKRRALTLSGVDLWIPREHLLENATSDRALEAIAEAIDFTSELAGLCGLSARDGVALALSVALPVELPPGARAELERRADIAGIALADHTPAEADAAVSRSVGVDPAALIGLKRDPALEVSRLGKRLAAARLSDLSDLGLRVAPGERGGRLDLLSYGVALATANYAMPVPIDLRGVADQPAALEACVQRFIRSPER